MEPREKFVFFWGGEFSQWYKAPIVIDHIQYNCNEQYMMASKALLFNDSESLNKILKSKSPGEQKSIGRSVKNFDDVIWKQHARLIVYRANFAKFTQHADLREILLNTHHREIVEASPEDFIWGIGMAENHPDILDRSKWLGTNWLGEILMQVRSDIISLTFHGKI